MYIKLHFDNGIALPRCFQVLDYILRNPSANSTNLMTNPTAHADFTTSAGYNSSLSEIIRTVEPANIDSYWGSNRSSTGANYETNHRFVLRMSSHDDTSQKYVIQYTNSNTVTHTNSNGGATIPSIGTDVTGSSFTNSTPLSAALSTSGSTNNQARLNTFDIDWDAENTRLGPGLSALPPLTDVNTFFTYITDDCFVWSITRSSSTVNGFPPYTGYYGNANTYQGPFLFSQYTRDDPFNTSNNANMYCVAYYNWQNAWTNTAAANGQMGLFHSVNQVSESPNLRRDLTQLAYDYSPLRMLKSRDVSMTNSLAANNIYNHVAASIKFGTYFNHDGGGLLDDPAYSNFNWGTAASTAYRKHIGFHSSSFAGSRYPGDDLSSIGFRLLPFGVYNALYLNIGGSITERSGLRIFCGNYTPGDTFTYDSKTYTIWPFPISHPTSYLIGLAVPKE